MRDGKKEAETKAEAGGGAKRRGFEAKADFFRRSLTKAIAREGVPNRSP